MEFVFPLKATSYAPRLFAPCTNYRSRFDFPFVPIIKQTLVKRRAQALVTCILSMLASTALMNPEGKQRQRLGLS